VTLRAIHVIFVLFLPLLFYTYVYYLCRRQSRESFFTSVCLRVSDLPHDITKNDADRINKLDIKMFHDEFWKSYILGSKGQRL